MTAPAMREFPFSQLRETFSIDDSYSDDNILVTDGQLDDLPKLVFRRHGPLARPVSGGQFQIPASTTGALHFVCAFDKPSVRIAPHCRLNADFRLWRDSEVSIGPHTTINQARLFVDNSEIHIGPDCMFSDDILLQSADQHGLIDMASLSFLNDRRRHIVLKEHVWVGRRCTIMPDVVIGEGSVIGTGSIATKDAAAFSFLVGVPARTVRDGGSWTRQPGQISSREQEFFDRARSVKADGESA